MVNHLVALIGLPRWLKTRGRIVGPFAFPAFANGFACLSSLLLAALLMDNPGISGPTGGVSPPVLRLMPDV
ncbi:hypothetical protein [Thermogemmatispora sp.]|jgi:hypothetical protein|uniref:hypothetical protein n=1 Tax=Thermogemmatispora sp. TaxID=1968838 RepID=UPI0035E4482F